MHTVTKGKTDKTREEIQESLTGHSEQLDKSWDEVTYMNSDMKAYQRQTKSIMFENAKRSRAEAACQEINTGLPKDDNRDRIWAGSHHHGDRFVMWMLEQA